MQRQHAAQDQPQRGAGGGGPRAEGDAGLPPHQGLGGPRGEDRRAKDSVRLAGQHHRPPLLHLTPGGPALLPLLDQERQSLHGQGQDRDLPGEREGGDHLQQQALHLQNITEVNRPKCPISSSKPLSSPSSDSANYSCVSDIAKPDSIQLVVTQGKQLSCNGGGCGERFTNICLFQRSPATP